MSIHRLIHLALLLIAALVAGASLGAWSLTVAAASGIFACVMLAGQGKHFVKLATFLTGVALVVCGGLAVEKSGLNSLAFTAALLALFVIWSASLVAVEDERISSSVSFYAALVIAFFLLGGLPLTWSEGLRVCVACIVVSLGIAAWGTGGRAKHLRRTKGEMGRGARAPAAAIGLVALVGVVLAAFLVPLPWAGERAVQLGDGLREAVPQLGRFADWISGRGGEEEPEEAAGSFGLNGGTSGYGFGRRRELPQRAELVQGSAPVVHLRIPDRTQFQKYVRGQGYVRSSVLERYIGDGWDEPEAEGGYRSDGNDGEIDGWVRLAESGEGSIEHEVFLPAAGGAGLPAIQNATAYQLGFLIESAPDMFEAELRGAVRYAAESTPRLWEDIRDLRPDPAVSPRPALGERASGQFGISLQLLTRKVTAAARTPAEKLDAIRNYLRDNHSYVTRIENKEERSAMENFLFGERAGWCDHFASAAVLMAREAGFPARMAFGFSGGRAFPKEQIISYHEYDAHAWAEVFVAGYGWVIFDATPQGEGAARAPGGGTEATAPDLSDYRAAESDPGEQRAERPRASLPPWVHWGLLAVAAMAVAVISVRLFLAKDNRDSEQAVKGRDEAGRGTPAYLREFIRLCQALGRPRGEGETLRETIAALGEIGVGATGLQPMADYHYGIQYEDAPRERSRENSLKKSLRVLRKAAQAG